MSYGNNSGYGDLPPLQENQQKRRQGCNPIFLIVVVIGIFIMFNGLKRPDGDGAPRDDGWSEPAQQNPRKQVGESSRNDKRAASDWDMQEMDAVESKQPKSTPVPTQNKKTEEGDWAIEEVGSTDSPDANESNTRTNNPSAKPQSKKTKKGDWEMEEVDGG